MVDKRKLSIRIKNKFPKLRFPQDYSNVLLSGWELKAIDKKSAKRSSNFSKINKIKVHVFSKCHRELDLLDKVERAEFSVSPMSERETVVFKFDEAQRILNIEKELILDHIEDSEKIQRILSKKLKFPLNSTVNKIKKFLNLGSVFKQGSSYEKIFNILKDSKIRSTGYLWFGIRPMPIPNYYLSKSAILLLKNNNKGVN